MMCIIQNTGDNIEYEIESGFCISDGLVYLIRNVDRLKAMA